MHYLSAIVYAFINAAVTDVTNRVSRWVDARHSNNNEPALVDPSEYQPNREQRVCW